MSENIPLPSTSGTSSLQHRKSKRKYDKTKLPTPPPDPTEAKEEQPADAQKEKDELLEYLDHLQGPHPGLSRSSSVFAPAIIAEGAFLHLEKLYKLMEQLLELREQNVRLQRRVRDLEHISNLEKMHKELDVTTLASIQLDCPYLERDTALAESYLESILAESRKEATPKPKPSAPTRIRHSLLRRNRSGSGTEKSLETEGLSSRRTSSCIDDRNKSSKVSKWTKVKAAFKWEKASVADAKSQDSGLSGMIPMNMEVARYLRVPSTSEEGHSPADSGAAGISTPGTLSTASSTEDFHRNLRTPCEDFRSSEDEYGQSYIPHSKDEQSSSQKSSIKSHRTPWAKMKDIIHTRNSFKKKNRLSTHSDDIQIDIEFCSDNEDVFEDEKTIQVPCTGGNPANSNRQRTESESDVPAEIVARYQQAVADDDTTDGGYECRKNSKWHRVKKAFLTNDGTKECRSDDESKSAQAEINRNYRQLQKKLSLEFQEKLSEWERLKQHSPGTSNPASVCGFSDETRDPAFIKKMEEWQRIKGQPARNTAAVQMPAQENLPPEFKKRLEEWNKMKRGHEKPTATTSKRRLGDMPRWKSISGPRTESSASFEYPALSDDFKKKLEEWKQIKASGVTSLSTEDGENRKSKDNKSPSPKLTRKNSSGKQKKANKEGPEKELQWFEKELNRIEREKQKLEAERQKFIEREERLSKLRNSVIGEKKEVRINTPSGSYRFEGISKKFAEKLYEWEKAQGIAPEASTFALLGSQGPAESRISSKSNSSGNTPPLMRSKSADSVAVSSTNLCTHMNTQPSSLSLNDVEELDQKCSEGLAEASSLQYLGNSHESMEQDEPEALIVEVEDIIEETASPLHTYLDKQQQPIYQREEIKAICEGETLAAPKIRRSESARAQVNYNLIEEISTLLSQLSLGEYEMEKFVSANKLDCQGNQASSQNIFEPQAAILQDLRQKLSRLQEANMSLITGATNTSTSSSQMNANFDQIQDLSLRMLHMLGKLSDVIQGRYNENDYLASSSTHQIIEELQDNLSQLRRHLNQICVASEHTATDKTFGTYQKQVAKKTVSSESRESKTETDLSRGSSDKSSAACRLYAKAASSTQSQGAIKKRIKYRQKNLQSRISPDTDEEEELNNEQKKKPRKPTKNRSISDNESLNEAPQDNNPAKKVCTEALEIDESLMKKVVIPTKTSYLNLHGADSAQDSGTDTPVTVFVKTTRKLFTPLIESQIVQPVSISNAPSPSVQEVDHCEQKPTQNESDQNQSLTSNGDTTKETTVEEQPTVGCFAGLPPFRASPSAQRRLKEISPSIRLMMVKYNQKVNEKDAKSGGSSGSDSPVAWRSPTSERRVKVQREKYQEEVLKRSPKLQREVRKSASVSHLQKDTSVSESSGESGSSTCKTTKSFDMAKSSSVGVITCAVKAAKSTGAISKSTDKKHPDLKVVINQENVPTSESLELRKRKIQKAKEEFLQSSPLSAPPQLESEEIQFPSRNRLSQVSMESGSSLDSTCAGVLMKSASAGMINIQEEVYRQIDPELHGGGYVSLPRSPKQQKQGLLGGKFDFSSIASKFRRVRMRRGKDRDKMNAVSALCRQSLVVDINRNDSEYDSSNTESRRVSSEDPSPSTSRSGSWIRKPKFFKK